MKHELFHRCAKAFVTGDGVLVIRCRIDLWRVEGRDYCSVWKEARRYWAQYFGEGEYDALLGPVSNLLTTKEDAND